MIDKSESIEDVEEQSQIFVKEEPNIFKKACAWLTAYQSSGLLTEEAQLLKIPKKPEDVQTSFPSNQPVMSEVETLDIYEKRMRMKLNTLSEIMMRDDPSLSKEEADKRAEEMESSSKPNEGDMNVDPDQDPGSNGLGFEDDDEDRPPVGDPGTNGDQEQDQA